jgi:23S rRNA (cytidine2498-2'-O)-methyltransferase
VPPAPPDPAHAFRRGDWLWLCRPGYENDLLEELELTGGDEVGAAAVATGLVRSARRPQRHGQPAELAYARQGFPVLTVVQGTNARALGEAIASMAQVRPDESFALHVFVPDSDALNPLASTAQEAERAAVAALTRNTPGASPDGAARHLPPEEAPTGKMPFVQACLLGRDVAVVGVLRVGQAVSLAPGGRRRMGTPRSAPSRAAAKLLEAFDWIGRSPEPSDVCVDLGAAPGGWSQVLLERRCKVIAVDPARLAPGVAKHRNLTHVQASAFEYDPEETADWVFCDMAWRPLEVAALLARWGRRRHARFLVANIKLPMKKKVEYIGRVKEILETGNWRDLRVRQLYHDRDEVTMAGWILV